MGLRLRIVLVVFVPVALICLIAANALSGARPDMDQRLERLARQFERAREFRQRLAIARQALALGEPGIRLVCSFLHDTRYQSALPSPDVRHTFNNQLALELARSDDAQAVDALRRYYYEGPRRGKLGRSQAYEIKFHWQTLVATAADEHGKRWALTPLWWYGSHDDLWLIRWQAGNRWSYPVFTGLGAFHGYRQAPKATLEASGGTFRATYPTHQMPYGPPTGMRTAEFTLEALTRDSDGDGLYDVEERRLRTDPAKADTDGDGLLDGEDLNPLVAPRGQPLTDEAAIRQAVFRQHARHGMRIAIVQAESDERQEYVSEFGGVVLSMSKREIEDFRKEAGYGVTTFIFDKITLNGERNRATVEFTDFTAPYAAEGLRIELRQMRGIWVVTGFTLTWIS